MPSIEDLYPKKSQKEDSEPARLASSLIGIKFKEKEKEAEAQAAVLGFPYINLEKFPVTQDAIALISKDQALRLRVICFYLGQNQARLGALNPDDSKISKLARQIQSDHNFETMIYKISEHSFNQALKIYDLLPKHLQVKQGLEITPEDLKKFAAQVKDPKDIQNLLKKISISDFIGLIIAGAIKSRATDIHVEPEENDVKIRYRIDGLLYDIAVITKDYWQQAISRLKLLARLKLNITAKPQDGGFTIYLPDETIDVRVSALPTAYGEGIVTRILMSHAAGIKFEDLGLTEEVAKKLLNEIKKLTGMILTTGPTGSGKTTTLYAILNKLNTADRKIITLEDPIEYKLKGVNQSQVDVGKGYTFAKGLRSILRQDPDIIMVGEIRDLETAEVAIDAALTGHLVVSTLHTNNSVAAIPRLLSLGVKSSIIGPALNAVIAQRLVRRLCPQCKVEDKLNPEILEKISKHLSSLSSGAPNKKFYVSRGCSACDHLGFKGRVGIFEIFIVDKNIQDLITKQAVAEKDLFNLAVKNGMLTMVQDGLLKALAGITSVSEIEREIGL